MMIHIESARSTQRRSSTSILFCETAPIARDGLDYGDRSDTCLDEQHAIKLISAASNTVLFTQDTKTNISSHSANVSEPRSLMTDRP